MNENIGPISDSLKAPTISNFPAIGAILGGRDTTFSGSAIFPVINPNIVVITIPINIPPLTCFISKTIATTRPIIPKIVVIFISPSPTIVAGLATTNPILINPINVINSPIPPPTAIFSGIGIA